MQPLATAEDVLRSFREIEPSIFHGRTSPDDRMNPIPLIKDLGFRNAVGAPSLDRSRPTGRRTTDGSADRAASWYGWTCQARLILFFLSWEGTVEDRPLP
jgi:hypothetical protein